MTERYGYKKKAKKRIRNDLFLNALNPDPKAKKIISDWGSDQFKKFRIP
jgi:hypothetical protein